MWSRLKIKGTEMTSVKPIIKKLSWTVSHFTKNKLYILHNRGIVIILDDMVSLIR